MDDNVKIRLKELIRKLCEKELDEITTTGNIDGYSTPFAFRDTGKGYKKKRQKRMKEALEQKDVGVIKKLIRDVVADIIRDIWIKRTSWK